MILNYIAKVFRSTWQMMALFVIALVIAVSYILVNKNKASTTDARVVTNVVPIAATVSGVVSHINIADNQYVKEGQSLFELSSEDIRLEMIHGEAKINVLQQVVENLQTRLDEAKAELKKQKLEVDHAKAKVAAKKSSSMTESTSDTPHVDVSKRRYELAKDKYDEILNNIELGTAKLDQKQMLLKEAKTAYDTAKNQMSQLVVTAPASGYISNFSLHEGTAVKAYHNLFGIIQPTPVWVIANFLETDLVRIRPGQSCKVHITMYPDKTFDGVVESIGYGIAPDSESQFSGVLPTVTPDSSWIRLSQRFPVRIRLHNPDPNFPMRVGANAQVKVHTER